MTWELIPAVRTVSEIENFLLRVSAPQPALLDLLLRFRKSAEVNHILTSTHLGLLQDCRVYKIAFDYLVSSLQNPHLFSECSGVFYLDRLREEECARGFVLAISKCFIGFDNLANSVALWGT